MMDDCVQMLKDWRRMCNAMTAMNGCEDCPIVRNTHGARCGDMPYEMQDVESIAREVKKWAAEHLEPVYPTWIEWLKSMGVVPYMTGLVVTRGADDGHFHDGHVNITAKALEAIPANIAEKLGIRPKEDIC